MDGVEKVLAYVPPFVYSKVTGIKSPDGVEAEGWLIALGATQKEMIAHGPQFTYQRVVAAAKLAKKLGAQIIGLGGYTKSIGDASATIARQVKTPLTTGNSYSTSGTLWATAEAVRRMGLVHKEEGSEKINGKTMVIGANEPVGEVCCRLLAKAFNHVYMVDTNDAKLLALRQSIVEETPGVKVHIATRSDKYISDMDVIVVTTAEMPVLELEKVKPGCVITDCAIPMNFSAEDAAMRQDVLIISSGEITLPGNPEMKDIGLPSTVAFAGMAETIVLCLEGRFENFTEAHVEWEKVREIYRMGINHGMKLAAISGVNGVISDDDIKRVRELALESQ